MSRRVRKGPGTQEAEAAQEEEPGLAERRREALELGRENRAAVIRLWGGRAALIRLGNRAAVIPLGNGHGPPDRPPGPADRAPKRRNPRDPTDGEPQ